MSKATSTHDNSNTYFGDREMKSVVAPPPYVLKIENVVSKNGKIDLSALLKHLSREGRLHKDLAKLILTKASELFKKEPNLMNLKDPITICGDIHGQFFDLLRLMEAGGDPAKTQYLFLGDYVDRGCFSTECVFYLMSHKIAYPKTFFMIRGNHECRNLTDFFNFKDECLFKYDQDMYDCIMNTFDTLPLAATINNKFLCCHGGLSPDITVLADIDELDRFQETPKEGPLCDIVWSDPVEAKEEDEDDMDMRGGDDDDDEISTWFSYNEQRRCSYVFGIDAVTTFLKTNNLTSIIRAHEAKFEGYQMHFIHEQTSIPRVITIFSAPNYCDIYNNKGACLILDNELINIRQFTASAHPYYLPNFMDVFTWSLPFVADKVVDMLYCILTWEKSEDDVASDKKKTEYEAKSSEKVKVKGSVLNSDEGTKLKQKVVGITKLLRMYKVLKENESKIKELKKLSHGKLSPGLLQLGARQIDKQLNSFRDARNADKINEATPHAHGQEEQEVRQRRKSSVSNPVFFRKSTNTSNNHMTAIEEKQKEN